MRSMQLGRRFGQNVQFGLGSSGLGRLAPYLVSRSDPKQTCSSRRFSSGVLWIIGIELAVLINLSRPGPRRFEYVPVVDEAATY
jgi:hypothetical protein